MKKGVICGVGINDANYVTKILINGKYITDPYYSAWANMIRRCYDPKFQIRSPTYIGCIACDEWLFFSNFKEWMEKQDWEGKELDKDIIAGGHGKLYSPDTCLFVSREINCLFTNTHAKRGKYPQGVCLNKFANKFQAQISTGGGIKYLGKYNTVEEASSKYLISKAFYIQEIADSSSDNKLSFYLNKIASDLFQQSNSILEKIKGDRRLN